MFGNSLLDLELFVEDAEFLSYKRAGVGTGRSKTGQRKKWKRRYWFEQDLMSRELRKLGETKFKNKHGGCSAADVEFIWQKIQEHVIRPRESFFHARNKLLMWLDKIHNDLSFEQISTSYHIGVATAVEYIQDLLPGMIEGYRDSNIISFYTEEQRMRMMQINKRRGLKMANALFTMDGKHAKCRGLHIPERRSPKYDCHIPCFTALFVIERTFGTICAYNVDQECTKHDITVLRESAWYQNLMELTNGWIIMADKGYVGPLATNIAAAHKRNSKRRHQWPLLFWKEMSKARCDSERIFSHFFVNKFKQLGNWPGKGKKSFKKWALNVTCAIIVYNEVKLRNVQVCDKKFKSN